ncbi:MAG: DUF5667 domain-containing protein [Candidatus Pacearchaeota archaeon]
MKAFTILTAMLIVFSAFVVAQTESDLGSPGITPDSPFYFLDRLFDGLQSDEARADEKAAEVLAMARESKNEDAERALELYMKSLENLDEDASDDEDLAARVAEKTSTHLVVLSGVLEQVPEQAKGSIERALEESARGREASLDALRSINPSRGEQVASETLTRVMANTPLEAQEGLQMAFQSIGKGDELSEAREEAGLPEIEEVPDTSDEIEIPEIQIRA